MKVKHLLVLFLLLAALIAGCGGAEEPRSLSAMAADVGLPTVYDYDGNVTSLSWLYEEFGPIQYIRVDPWPNRDVVYRLVALTAQCEYATLKVDVVDENGYPLKGVTIVRYWPGAPVLPDFSDVTQQWTSLGVHGETDTSGAIGFGMGGGDYYYTPDAGVSSVYAAEFDGPSDYLTGLGMLGSTEHCHIDSKFQRMSDEVPPTPTPPPTEEPGECDCGSWDVNLSITGTIEEK